jgi:hypothetical protein
MKTPTLWLLMFHGLVVHGLQREVSAGPAWLESASLVPDRSVRALRLGRLHSLSVSVISATESWYGMRTRPHEGGDLAETGYPRQHGEVRKPQCDLTDRVTHILFSK